MSDPEIPDRTFVDDLGRRWEWCGGQPRTWAWRVTDPGQGVAGVQSAIVDALNTVGPLLLGADFKPFELSPIPDSQIAALINQVASEIEAEQ